MIATVTKRFVTVGKLNLTAGTEVEVHPDQREGTVQVEYRDKDGNIHIEYDVRRQWFDNLVVYRRAKALGYE